VPAVQRNFLNRALVDDGADGRRRRLDDGNIGRDLHLLGDRADVQLKVLHDGSCDFDGDVINNLRFETLDLYFDRVDADRQCGQLVVAVGVRLSSAFE
jgi:hypothetical protein